MYGNIQRLLKEYDNRIKNLLTVIGMIILIALYARHENIAKTEFVFDVLGSIGIVIIFFKFYRRLNQDCISWFFLIFALVLHNLALYETTLLGIRFDHYMHFVGGFTLAIIGDRLFKEKLTKPKRFVLVMVFALGIGAVGEIAEWLGYGILGEGDGFFFYGMGDEGEWRNSILDLVFNTFGASAMAAITLFRKKPNNKGKKSKR